MARSDLGRRTSACPKVRNKATGPSVASGRRRDRGRGTWRRERRVTRCTGRIDTYRSYHAAWLPMWSNKRVKGRCAGRCVPRRRGSVYFGGDENSSSGTSKSIATSLLGQKRAAGRARKKRRLRARGHVPGPLLFRPFSTLSVSRGELTMVQKLRAPLGGTDLSPPFTAG